MENRSETLVRRYARGLAESLSGQKMYDRVSEDLKEFTGLLNKHPGLKRGMVRLLLSPRERDEWIEWLGKRSGWHDVSRGFLRLLSRYNRLMLLEEILEDTRIRWNRKNRVEEIRVFSTRKLTVPQTAALSRALKKATGKTIRIQNRLDPSLIAGIKLQRGYTVTDFSLQGNLKRLRNYLTREG